MQVGALANVDLPAAAHWVLWLSVFVFAGSLMALPIVIIRIPADYFVQTTRRPETWRARHPVIRYTLLALKNVAGFFFLVAGLVMLLTPGQGIVSILVGLWLMDIPGKRAWQRRIVSRPSVHRTLNKIRTMAGHPPLQVPPGEGHPPDVASP